MTDLEDTRVRLQAAAKQLNGTFVKRAEQITALIVSALAGEHVLFIGDPGTGKTALCRAFSQHVDGAKHWQLTFGNFTPPEAVFGPLDPREFAAGNYVHKAEGNLQDADLGMADEIFKGPQVVNELLEIMQSRTFKRQQVPLLSLAAACNWPEMDERSEITDALYDRFLTRVIVERLTERADRIAVMKAAAIVDKYEPADDAIVSIEDLRAASAASAGVAVDDVIYDLLCDVVGRLEPKSIRVSDRRLGKLVRLLQAHAWFEGRDQVTVEDASLLVWGMWDRRNDIESIEVVLSDIDKTYVKELHDVVDDARRAFTDAKSAGFTPSRVNVAFKKFGACGKEIKRLYDRPVYTKAGREKCRTAMEALKADFEELRSHKS